MAKIMYQKLDLPRCCVCGKLATHKATLGGRSALVCYSDLLEYAKMEDLEMEEQSFAKDKALEKGTFGLQSMSIKLNSDGQEAVKDSEATKAPDLKTAKSNIERSKRKFNVARRLIIHEFFD